MPVMDRTMLSLACASSLVLGGCAQSVTRSQTLPLREAWNLDRGTIVSVERDGRTIPVASSSESADGHDTFVTRDGHTLTLAPDDRVTVERTYRKGEEVPGEGVVVMGPSVPLIVVGSVVTAAAGGLVGGMAACASSSSPSPNQVLASADVCYVVFVPAIGITGGVGLSLIAAGLVPRAKVSRSVEVSPSVGPKEAGLALTMRF